MECFDISEKIQLIRARQKLRDEEGFSPNNHPQNKPGFHSMNQSMQLEERQRFERQSLEHQNDEQSINTLGQRWNQARQRAKGKLVMMDEVLVTFGALSQVLNEVQLEEKELPPAKD